MFERLIQFAIEQRIIVLLAVLLMAGLGIASYQKLPIDAVPDITNVQVQINTGAAGFSHWRQNSESPSPSKPPWPACQLLSKRVRSHAQVCRKSP